MTFPDGQIKDGFFEENIYIGPANKISLIEDLNLQNEDLARM
jgi:hypothetical protein